MDSIIEIKGIQYLFSVNKKLIALDEAIESTIDTDEQQQQQQQQKKERQNRCVQLKCNVFESVQCKIVGRQYKCKIIK